MIYAYQGEHLPHCLYIFSLRLGERRRHASQWHPHVKRAGGSIMLRGVFSSSWDWETGQAWVRPEWSKVLENLTQSTQDLRLGWRFTLPRGSGSKCTAGTTRERFRETLWMFLIGPAGGLTWTQSNFSEETWKCPSTNSLHPTWQTKGRVCLHLLCVYLCNWGCNEIVFNFHLIRSILEFNFSTSMATSALSTWVIMCWLFSHVCFWLVMVMAPQKIIITATWELNSMWLEFSGLREITYCYCCILNLR